MSVTPYRYTHSHTNINILYYYYIYILYTDIAIIGKTENHDKVERVFLYKTH